DSCFAGPSPPVFAPRADALRSWRDSEARRYAGRPNSLTPRTLTSPNCEGHRRSSDRSEASLRAKRLLGGGPREARARGAGGPPTNLKPHVFSDVQQPPTTLGRN